MGVRTNLFPNPRWQNNVTDGVNTIKYNGSAVTVTQDTTKGVSPNTKSIKFNAGDTFVDDGDFLIYNLTAGTYTVSSYIATASSGTGGGIQNAHFVARDASGTYLNGIHVTSDTGGVFSRYSFSFTVSSTQNITILIGLGSYGAASQGVAWFTNMLLEQTGTLKRYFDGAFTTAGYTYGWLSTADNSSSTETSVTPTAGTKFRDNGTAGNYVATGANTTYGGNNGMFGVLGSSPSVHIAATGGAYVFEGAELNAGSPVTIWQMYLRTSATATTGNGMTLFSVYPYNNYDTASCPIRIDLTPATGGYKFSLIDPTNGNATTTGATLFTLGLAVRLVLSQTISGWQLFVNNATTPEVNYAFAQVQLGFQYASLGTVYQNASGGYSGVLDFGELWFRNANAAPSGAAAIAYEMYQGYLQNHLAVSGQPYRGPADGSNGSYANGYIDTVSEDVPYLELFAVQNNDQATLILVDNWVLNNLLRKNSTTANSSNNAAPTQYLNLMCFKYNSANSDGKGIGTIYDANFASDADIERIQALLWAHARYGSSSNTVGAAAELTTPNYLQRALNVAADLKSIHTAYNSMQYLWNDTYQTGTTIQMGGDYYAPAVYKLLAQYDTANATFWNQALAGCYDAHTKAANVIFSGASPAQSTTAKLNPNWYAFNTSTGAVSTTPSTYGDSDYGFNAFRIYQRLYDMYKWYNDANALTALQLPKSFFTSEYSANSAIRATFRHDGTNTGNYESNMFTYAAYWVLYAGDTGNTTASALQSNKLANRFSQQPYGSIFNETPASGTGSVYGYFGQSWLIRNYMTANNLWTNYGQATVSVNTNLFFFLS